MLPCEGDTRLRRDAEVIETTMRGDKEMALFVSPTFPALSVVAEGGPLSAAGRTALIPPPHIIPRSASPPARPCVSSTQPSNTDNPTPCSNHCSSLSRLHTFLSLESGAQTGLEPATERIAVFDPVSPSSFYRNLNIGVRD